MVPTPKFAKNFKKLDPFVRKQIKSYLNRVTENPRAKGKALVVNRTGQWRYCIGAYRVIVNIQDNELIILALEVGHRRDIY
ncbi:MAG: type II toxin-antitoxin system RelE/ParE family toxin [Streptococcus salivarius]|nr:type II toxin-antitoxin system RelE/ParE family toxin [Streptococcus salivarius]